jgi:hypothetical protein
VTPSHKCNKFLTVRAVVEIVIFFSLGSRVHGLAALEALVCVAVLGSIVVLVLVKVVVELVFENDGCKGFRK